MIEEKMLHRSGQVKAIQVDDDDENYRFELSFSSEEPYERYFGVEILGHKSSEIRMDWISSGNAPLLLNHDSGDVIGVIEKTTFADGKGVANVRFSKNPKAQEVRQDVIDGIRSNVSVGYVSYGMILQEEHKDEASIYRVNDWEPLEVSIVGVPADQTVGVGRDQEPNEILKRHIESIINPKGNKQSINEKLSEKEHLEIKSLAKELTIKNNKENNMESNERTKMNAEKEEMTISSSTDETLRKERERIAEITMLGRKYELEREADQYIEKGTEVEQFRKYILDRIAERSSKNAPTMEKIGLSHKEQSAYSVRKAIMGMMSAARGEPGAWDRAELELEVSNHLKREQNKDTKGVIIPQDALVSRDFLRSYNRAAGDPIGASPGFGNPAGGNLVETDLRPDMFIEALRNASVVMSMGVRMMPGLVGDVDIPKDGTQPNVFWVGEDGVPTGSDVDFGNVDLKLKTIGGWQRITQKLIKQSTPQAEDIIRGNLTRSLSLGIQDAIINGAGTADIPEGILQLGSLAVVDLGTNGGTPDFGAMVDLETEVAQDNADIGNLGYITNTRVRGVLKQTPTFVNASGVPVWQNNQVNDYQAWATNAMPRDLTKGTSAGVCSAIIFGNWADVIVGMWGGVELTIDTTTHADKRGVIVRAFQDLDIKIAREESFAAILDALTA